MMSDRDDRSFRAALGGVAVFSVADSVAEVAIPLVAVLWLNASPVETAALIAVESASWLLLGLPVGVWVDRWSKRAVVVNTSLVRAILIATIPIAAYLDVLSLTQLFVVVGAYGALEVFASVAQTALIPSVVDRSSLVDANGRLSSTSTVMDLAGKGIAGPLISTFGAPLTLLFDAVASVIAGRCFSLIKVRGTSSQPGGEVAKRRAFRAELLDGLRLTLGDSIFRAMTMSQAALNLVTAAQYSLTFLFLIRVLEVPTALIGAFLAAGSVGGLLGASIAGRLTRRFGSGRVWRAALVLAPAFGLTIPLAQQGPGAALFLIGSFALSVGLTIANILSFSARQAMSPPELLGRVSGTARFLTWGLIPVGALLGGLLGELLGVRNALWISAIAYFVGLVPALGTPLLSAVSLEEVAGKGRVWRATPGGAH